MGDCTMILSCLQSNHGRILHCDGQETGIDPLGRCALIVYGLKFLSSIFDFLSDAWSQTYQKITSLLIGIFWIIHRTEKILAGQSTVFCLTINCSFFNPRGFLGTIGAAFI